MVYQCIVQCCLPFYTSFILHTHTHTHQELDALYPPPSQQDGSSRLVEILREENSSLKKELESYYQRVRKLQKVSSN